MKHLQKIIIIVFVGVIVLSGSHQPAAQAESGCGYHPSVPSVMDQSNIASWLYWVEVLSGEKPAQLDNFPVIIRTRNTKYMFDGSSDARAYDYVLQQVKNWYPDNLIIEHTYPFGVVDAKNIIVTIPGTTMPDEYVLLGAHLDDTAWYSSRHAPGANDNAIGAATLLEAARLFRQLNYERSIRIVWFTGEEAGLIGSRAYVNDYGDLDYRGVINLDMFGWDGDGDRCFEIHVGGLPASNEIGTCMVESIESYPHDLTYDYLISGATGRSDHYTFWYNEIGAIGISENFQERGSAGGCVGVDMNPYYHRVDDTIELNLTPDYANDIARAALETTASLATPITDIIQITPTLTISNTQPGIASMEWIPIPGANAYRVFRSSFGCQDWGLKIAETSDTQWADESVRSEWPYQYRIEAVLDDGITVSQPSNCVAIGPKPPPVYLTYYLPLIAK